MASTAEVQPEPVVVVYDGECPVCSAYVRYVRIKESVGGLSLYNARDGGEWIERIKQAGLNLDEGMVLIYAGRMYHGVDCIHMLALLSTRSGAFNRINAALFSRPKVAAFAYPILRAGRNLLLKLLNRSRLNLNA